MDMIERIEARVRPLLAELAARAEREQWDEARIEHEKSLFELNHEVTLCSVAGCLNMVHPIPGFRDLTCAEHSRS